MKHAGWVAVERDSYVNIDMENSPLQIKTNSEIGSGAELAVSMMDSMGQPAGDVNIYWTSPPQYAINQCIAKTDFPTDLPSENEKVWTFSRTSFDSLLNERRIVINCNDKEVLNIVLDDTTCGDEEWRHSEWEREGRMIRVLTSDSASDFYRKGKFSSRYASPRYAASSRYAHVFVTVPFFRYPGS